MFDHVGIRVSDRAASERFYRSVLGTLGLEPTFAGTDRVGDELVEWDDFALQEGTPVTRGLHLGFRAPSRSHVDAFWRAGIEAGFEDDGEPGPRPVYGDDYYGGFLRDPDGNSAEAAHHDGIAEGGTIDHVWVRVADVAASAAFYDLVLPLSGLPSGRDYPASDPLLPRRVQYASERGGSFSVVDGGPRTEHVHLAFPAASNETVDAFHAAAVAAGSPDNGGPGERAYHAGYYAAFVLDPDGHNVELVNHNR
jgi:catechol 2,3-dioxygenase-like lactoylglutathione lyase family enzyme